MRRSPEAALAAPLKRTHTWPAVVDGARTTASSKARSGGAAATTAPPASTADMTSLTIFRMRPLMLSYDMLATPGTGGVAVIAPWSSTSYN